MQERTSCVEYWTPDRIQVEISATEFGIRSALWATPAADVERAKALISKRTGLRILAGERTVKLKPPVHFDSEALAAG
jgi:hypothetical protein